MKMGTQIRAFRPLSATQATNVTASSQGVAINNLNGTRAIRFCNLGTSNVWISFGQGSAPTATTSTSMPLPAGQTEIFTVGPDITHYGFIGSGTDSVLYSTVGEGF